MKYIVMVLFVLTPLLCKSQTTQNKNPQNKNLHSSINTSGGDISGQEGSVSYSIAQVYYSSFNDEENYITEGIQQPLMISTNPVDKEENEDFRVVAYPNPAVNYLKIIATNYENRSLNYHLLDLNGRLLKADQIGESGAEIDISRLSLAVYLLRISDNGQHIKTIKIIKK